MDDKHIECNSEPCTFQVEVCEQRFTQLDRTLLRIEKKQDHYIERMDKIIFGNGMGIGLKNRVYIIWYGIICLSVIIPLIAGAWVTIDRDDHHKEPTPATVTATK